MGKIKAAITGVSGYVPEDIMTNFDLEKLVETNDEWIVSRTGIKQRHILKDPKKAMSDLGVEAVNKLLAKTGTKPEEIDMLIVGTITGDYVFPDTANLISHKIGAKNAFGFDINAACSGFIYSLMVGAKFVESGSHKKVIIVGGDKMSSILNYEDRATCILFGDGAGAVLLEPSEDGNGIQNAILKSDGSGSEYLYMKAGGSLNPPTAETVANREHFVTQDGRIVFKAAIKGMSESIRDLMEKNNLTQEDIDWIIPHQANNRIITAVGDQVGFPSEKVLVNIHNYGNTTAGTIPLVLSDFEDKFKKGDKIILTAFGGGFTWGSILLHWAY